MGPERLATLVEWLDAHAEPEADGLSYVAMHRRLSSYFARKACRVPEELADETLNRVARRLQEEGAITDVAPAQYCYIVARFVFLEHLRSPEHMRIGLVRDVPDGPARTQDEESEQLLACLDSCLAALDADDRALILTYYSGTSTERIAIRRALASSLGLTPNAIAIRASRLRDQLRICLGKCAGRQS